MWNIGNRHELKKTPTPISQLHPPTDNPMASRRVPKMTNKAKLALEERLATMFKKRKGALDVDVEPASMGAKRTCKAGSSDSMPVASTVAAAPKKRQDSRWATVTTEEEEEALHKDTIVIDSDDEAPRKTSNGDLDTGSVYGSEDEPEGAEDELSEFYLPDTFY